MIDLRIEPKSMGKSFDNLERQIVQMEKFKDRIKAKDVENLVNLWNEFSDWYTNARIEVTL